MDNTTLEKLNYYDIKEIVKGYCISGLGKALIDKLEPSTNIKVVKRRLDETSEGRALLDASYHIPLDGVFNILSLIEKMEKGASLEPENLIMISDFLRGCRKVKNFMKDKEGYAPTLSLYSDNITEIEYIEEEINISITGNRVDSNASKELKKIRKRIDMCEGKIKEKLEKFLEMIYERIKDLKMNIDVISELDMIWAKAKYSNDIQGIQPKINDYGYIKIVKGCNPLIKNPVPLDFEIGSNYRSLIITGPNAGGKTVVLKTVGMLTLQTMLGFHIKAKRDTEVSIFNKIFVDIGDNQSIENALSTFSSHVKNLAHIIKESNKSTLLLFDEIGSGTEPNEGAALAIAALEDLYKKGCIII